jgi:proteasome lid subunit RPN8/RPN11
MTDSQTEYATGYWATPQCPFAVEYSPRVLDDIRLAVIDAFFSLPRGGAEIGGILLGRYEDGRLIIRDHAPLDCEHAFGPSFTLSPRDEAKLADLLAEARGNSPEAQPVGWYHSHTRSDIFLSETDLTLHKKFFAEPWQVALVLKPHTFHPTRGGFFFREVDGSIHATASYQEFELENLAVRPVPVGVIPPLPTRSQPPRREREPRGPVITVEACVEHEPTAPVPPLHPVAARNGKGRVEVTEARIASLESEPVSILNLDEMVPPPAAEAHLMPMPVDSTAPPEFQATTESPVADGPAATTVVESVAAPPAVEEGVALPLPEEVLAAPPVEEAVAPPVAEEAIAPSPVEAAAEPPAIEEAAVAPTVEEATAPPIVEEVVAPPVVEAVIEPPVADRPVAVPPVEVAVAPISVEEPVVVPVAEEIVVASPVEEAIAAPVVEEAIAAPMVEEAVAAPATEEVVAPPPVAEAVAPPVVEEALAAPEVEAPVAPPAVEAAASSPVVEEIIPPPPVDAVFLPGRVEAIAPAHPGPTVAPEPVSTAATESVPKLDILVAPAATELPCPRFLDTEPKRSRRWLKVSLAVAAGLAAVGTGLGTRGLWLPRVLSVARPAAHVASAAPVAPPSLGLNTVDSDGQLQIRWDRSSVAVRRGVDAILEITDGDQPQPLPLDAAHLQTGVFTYARQGARVDVSLVIHELNGKQTREATSFLGQPPAPKVAPPPATDNPPLRKERDALVQQVAQLKSDLNAQTARAKDLEKNAQAAGTQAARIKKLEQDLAAQTAHARELEKSAQAAGTQAARTKKLEQDLAAQTAHAKELEKSAQAAGTQAARTKKLEKDLAAQTARVKELEKSAQAAGVQAARIKQLEKANQDLQAQLQRRKRLENQSADLIK